VVSVGTPQIACIEKLTPLRVNREGCRLSCFAPDHHRIEPCSIDRLWNFAAGIGFGIEPRERGLREDSIAAATPQGALADRACCKDQVVLCGKRVHAGRVLRQ